MKIFDAKPTNSGTEPKKPIVIELYSTFEGNDDALTHELTSNGEIGAGLRSIHAQQTRFIYALNEPIIDKMKNEEVVNLADNDGLDIFLKTIKPGDSLTIIAQGNLTQQSIRIFL